MDINQLSKWRNDVFNELTNDILPFWMNNTIDRKNGGFYGCITNNLKKLEDAPKGLILNSRILWTFADAYNAFKKKEYLDIASYAYNYMTKYFFDFEFGGAYWLLDSAGRAVDNKKKTYGQAFVIYALAEYYSATGYKKVLDQAFSIFELIEKFGYDNKFKGYFEAFNRNWSIAEDMRLSDVDINEKKSMNAHLHLLESYTNLYRVSKDEKVRYKLVELIDVFLSFIINKRSCHLNLFFDEKWEIKSRNISFGHDIESSWLLCEASDLVNDSELKQRVYDISKKMVEVTQDEGLNEEGGIYQEKDGTLHKEVDWWLQAEAVIGFLNAYQLTNSEPFLEQSYACWKFIERYLIDKEYGEWFYEVSEKGIPNPNLFKVSEWKGPYHNGRACMEIMKRLDAILQNNK